MDLRKRRIREGTSADLLIYKSAISKSFLKHSDIFSGQLIESQWLIALLQQGEWMTS